MKKLEFTKQINAPAQKVWDVLWSEDTYPQWTKAFNPGGVSTVKSDWKIGGKTIFGDAKGNGILSTIKSKNEPYELVFEHLGEIVEGKEDTTSERVKSWAGSLEGYHLTENEGITTLKATIESVDEWAEMLTKGFTKGLEVVREVAERR